MREEERRVLVSWAQAEEEEREDVQPGHCGGVFSSRLRVRPWASNEGRLRESHPGLWVCEIGQILRN